MGKYYAKQLYKGLYFVYGAEREPPFVDSKSGRRYELHSVHLFSDNSDLPKRYPNLP